MRLPPGGYRQAWMEWNKSSRKDWDMNKARSKITAFYQLKKQTPQNLPDVRFGIPYQVSAAMRRPLDFGKMQYP